MDGSRFSFPRRDIPCTQGHSFPRNNKREWKLRHFQFSSGHFRRYGNSTPPLSIIYVAQIRDISPPSSQSSMAINSPILPKMAPLNALKNRSLGNFVASENATPVQKALQKGIDSQSAHHRREKKNPHVPPKVNNNNARHSPRKTTRNYVRTNNRRRRRPTTPFVVISPIVYRGGKTSSASLSAPYH